MWIVYVVVDRQLSIGFWEFETHTRYLKIALRITFQIVSFPQRTTILLEASEEVFNHSKCRGQILFMGEMVLLTDFILNSLKDGFLESWPQMQAERNSISSQKRSLFSSVLMVSWKIIRNILVARRKLSCVASHTKSHFLSWHKSGCGTIRLSKRFFRWLINWKLFLNRNASTKRYWRVFMWYFAE